MKWSCLALLITISCSGLAQVTYNEHIAPIISKHCVSCHQKGDIGPMPLSTYEEVRSYASMINFVIDIKLMPPFKANHKKVKYQNERSVSDKEKALLISWLEGGMLEGKKNIALSEENIEHPVVYDTTICMSESFQHYGIYYDQYQVFPLQTHFLDGRFVKEIIFEPGNKEIVRSAQMSLAPIGASIAMDNWDPRYGYYAYGSLGFTTSHPNWYSWMPHTKGLELTEKEQLFIPSNSEILMHIHYGPFGQVESDSSCIHLNFDKKNGSKTILQNIPLVHTSFLKDSFLLEAENQHRFSNSFILPVETELKSVTPLAHLLCKSWEVFAVFPDKSSVSLLSIKDWDFHWREKYVFEKPIHLPAGTKIYASAIYDNTSQNPYNPAVPPHTMTLGPHMFDENFICYFELVNRQNKGATIHKPFVTTNTNLEELNFRVESKGLYSLNAINVASGKSVFKTSKLYSPGKHTIRSSSLPSTIGKYVITMKLADEIVDVWWLVIL